VGAVGEEKTFNIAPDEVSTASVTHCSTYGATTGATLTNKITKYVLAGTLSKRTTFPTYAKIRYFVAVTVDGSL